MGSNKKIIKSIKHIAVGGCAAVVDGSKNKVYASISGESFLYFIRIRHFRFYGLRSSKKIYGLRPRIYGLRKTVAIIVAIIFLCDFCDLLTLRVLYCV